MAFWFWAAATAVWFVLMTVLSHQDGPHTGEVSRTLAQELHPLLPAVDQEALNRTLRRAAHPLLFGGGDGAIGHHAAYRWGAVQPGGGLWRIAVVVLGRRGHQTRHTWPSLLMAGCGA